MRISIGSDHAGFDMKEKLEAHLREAGFDVDDVGTHDHDSVDYPEPAARVAQAVSSGAADRGVLVCGSGIGVAIAANKVRGVRAANVSDPEMARMSRLHNDANIVTIGGRYVDEDIARKIVDAFLAAEFEGGRHQRRVDAIAALEDTAG